MVDDPQQTVRGQVDSPPRAVANQRGGRTDHTGTSSLVQPPTAAPTHRLHPTCKGRCKPLPATRQSSRRSGSLTETERPPPIPQRFSRSTTRDARAAATEGSTPRVARSTAACGVEQAKAVRATGFIARHAQPIAGQGRAGKSGLNRRVRRELRAGGIGGSRVGQRVCLQGMTCQEARSPSLMPGAATKLRTVRAKTLPAFRFIRCSNSRKTAFSEPPGEPHSVRFPTDGDP